MAGFDPTLEDLPMGALRRGKTGQRCACGQATGVTAKAVGAGAGRTDAHIAARGLTVPLRSGIVRGMAAQGAERAVAAGVKANVAVQLLAVDAASIHSTIATSGEARSGQCAAAFPIF